MGRHDCLIASSTSLSVKSCPNIARLLATTRRGKGEKSDGEVQPNSKKLKAAVGEPQPLESNGGGCLQVLSYF
eukprot:scaffold584_cov132-Cylindrotheca_fusiformis.AAC.16